MNPNSSASGYRLPTENFSPLCISEDQHWLPQSGSIINLFVIVLVVNNYNQTSRFPKNEDLLIKWVDALQRPDWEPTIRSFVCSAHFADSAMYFSKSGLRKLVQDAVPEISLENIDQSKHKNRRKRKAGNKVVMPYMYVATFDDTRKRDSLKRECTDSVSCSKKDRADTYTPQATDCPMKRKLKKRIINLTKLSKRRRLRCNALYASLNRIRKKVTVMTQTLKDLQQKISINPQLNSGLESCGVSTTELFKGIWKKEKSCSPEPQEEEEYFYSEVGNCPEPNKIKTHCLTATAMRQTFRVQNN